MLAFLDYPAGRGPSERVRDLLPSVLAEAHDLVEARGILESIPVDDAPHLFLKPVPAEALVIGLVSIGGALEDAVTRYAREGETVRAVLLDAAGSAAVEQAADRISSAAATTPIADRDRDAIDGPRPVNVPCRWSPGYGDWPLEAQKEMFRRLPHNEIGVRLLPSMLMAPRKSISFALWLGGDARATVGGAGCARCPLDRCRYRKGDRVDTDESNR